MFINGHEIEENSSFNSSVCIVGGGMAGITIALELKKQGVDVCILESGGHAPDNATRDLYRGENIGVPYIFSDGCRSRFLGGSSNCWGGWCAPMDAHDFEKRDWVNESGWPISLTDIVSYYKRAHEVLQLGPYNYNASFWEKAINHPEVKRIEDKSGILIDKISQFSPPVRMGSVYQDELKKKDIRVFLHSNVTDIECNEDGNEITRMRVSSLNGNSFFITSRVFILATGGIENARLLLSSDNVHQNGLGNSNDLVGRYFMDHLRISIGKISFANGWGHNRLYDLKYHYHSRIVSALGSSVASQFAVKPEVQEREGLLNARVSFSSVLPGEGTTGALALWNCKQALKKKASKNFSASREIFNIISHPIDASSYGLTRIYRPHFLVKSVKFYIITEQEPNPQSRVTLSDEKDQLGMRRVKVDWQIGSMEQHTIDKTLSIVGQKMQESGVASKVEIDRKLTGNEWPEDIEGVWHHMGTTRMHQSPKKGVVNKDCKVHGIENLYVAGSSVFPTGGANFPTITLVALALRLSDHITNKLSENILKVSKAHTNSAEFEHK
ncbi:MAG: GMC family oxidoreductase [Chitinophagaceae bacterium]